MQNYKILWFNLMSKSPSPMPMLMLNLKPEPNLQFDLIKKLDAGSDWAGGRG